MKSFRLSQLQRAAIAFAILLGALLSHAGAAWAHASLNAAEPRDGAVVEAGPERYSLIFSEPVSPLSLRLVKPDGTSVPLDRYVVKTNTVEIEAPAELGRGTHVLSWRVVSADGHPIGGSVIFSIGEQSAQAPMVANEIDWTVRAGLWLSKLALYVGLFIGIGGVCARRILMPTSSTANFIISVALALGAAGAVLSLGFQGLDALGVSIRRIVEPAIWSAGLSTSYGNTVLAALVAFGLAGTAQSLSGRLAMAITIVAWLLAAAALALSGHASAASPQWLMRPAIFLHAVCIAAWIGALAPLELALARRQRDADRALTRFSGLIPYVIAALIAAGVLLTVVQVEQPSALITTAYGQLLLVKLALLVGLFLLAAVNRWSLTALVEAGDPAARRRLVRSIAIETLIVLLIFGIAAAWRFTPPPRALAAAAAMPATMHIHTDKAMADLTVSPGRVGSVIVSAVVMSGDFGPLDAREVTFVFSNPSSRIEPFKRKAAQQPDGAWRAEGIVFPLPGEWTVRIDVLISDFEMARLDGRVLLRP
ncbi:MAG: CopD family protein [Rhizobiaceae bacterium]